MEKINIGLIGHGVVGQGVREILEENKAQITQKLLKSTGKEIEVGISKILVKDKSKHQSIQDKYQLVDSFEEILEDSSISLVVEVMGGKDPATTYIKESLKTKNVVSANKLAIAQAYEELHQIAEKNKTSFKYEASCLAGVPVIKTIEDLKGANTITSLRGILNGTTNFILSKMAEEGLEYEEALEIAQAKGFAEADPSSDVEGLDSKYKLFILSQLSFGKAELKEIKVSGITQVTKEAIEKAKAKGNKLKLVGRAELIEDKYYASVGVEEILPTDSLYSVDNEINGLEINTQNCGQLFLKGAGAGSRPTASGVVGDILEIIGGL